MRGVRTARPSALRGASRATPSAMRGVSRISPSALRGVSQCNTLNVIVLLRCFLVLGSRLKVLGPPLIVERNYKNGLYGERRRGEGR